jgi:hypothetical protein
VATAKEGDETKQVEHEGDHRDGLSPDQGRQINHLAAGEGLANDRLQGPNATEERFHLTELIVCITVLAQ